MAIRETTTARSAANSVRPRYLRLVTIEGNVVGRKPPKAASPQRIRLSALVARSEHIIASISHANHLLEQVATTKCDDAVFLRSAAREAWMGTETATRMLEALSEDLQRVEL